MAQLIELVWKLKNTGLKQESSSATAGDSKLFNTTRIVSVVGDPSGPGDADGDINSRVVYLEDFPLKNMRKYNEYFVKETLSAIETAANA